ncbi:MAG: molybdopterin cofactor-binding domain-containing protein [Pseudomonadota bacterium]
MNKWTRRAFISSGALVGGGIIVGVAIRPGNLAHDVADVMEADGETLVHAYVKIDTNNVVTAIVPHAEMGQGAQTALAQMLAEELDADWEQVRFEEAPALGAYNNSALGRGMLLTGVELPGFIAPTVEGAMLRLGDFLNLQITGGSLSIRATGQYGMRFAGAATKHMLKRAAADAWDVPLADIDTQRSTLHHRASGKSEPYATFAVAAAALKPSYTPTLKDPKDFSIIGQSVPRHDIPSKVDGTAQFALDVRLPGMVYATTMRAPVFGGRIASLDDSTARSMNGVLDVIKLPATSSSSMIGGYEETGETVAVVADSYWTARNALNALGIVWDNRGNDSLSTADVYSQHDNDLAAAKGREPDFVRGNIESAMTKAAQVVSADYRVPFLAHTCMEPINATVHLRNGVCDVWVGCQNPLGVRRAVAEVLDANEDQVTLHNQFMGGGFGRKAVPDGAVQAALIAKAVERPVQLIWSREEDVRQDFYRTAATSQFRAALDDSGVLQGWENTYVEKGEPVEAPLIPYAVPAQDIGSVASPTHVPKGSWRSVDESQQAFFTESFIDECAAAAGVDPVAYRATLLADSPRHLAVLERAAREANWDAPLGLNRARGIAIKECFGSITAEVVEITVIEGAISIDRVVAVIDLGLAVSPDGVRGQIESGIIYGLTAAMTGEITINNGAVVQSNFHDYTAMRMPAAPVIETHIINSGHHIGGAGEPGTPPAAPALANAIFAATGQRIRELPLAKRIRFVDPRPITVR